MDFQKNCQFLEPKLEVGLTNMKQSNDRYTMILSTVQAFTELHKIILLKIHSILSRRSNNVQFENLTMEVLLTVLVPLQITENFLCNFSNYAVSTADYIPLGDWVIDELGKIWKAAVRT